MASAANTSAVACPLAARAGERRPRAERAWRVESSTQRCPRGYARETDTPQKHCFPQGGAPHM
eukprot:1299727-Prymnesium_polylepis.3